MDFETLLSDSGVAFVNGQFGKALDLAKKAIEVKPDNADAYQAAANASMSLDNYELAADYYKNAVKYDQNNGNRYFNLGYALCAAGKTADALKSFTKADELGCSQENTAQLYHLLGIICFDIGKLDDSLINLKKAEQIMGPDMELLERMSVIYGLKEDVRNGIFTANQMKMISPSSYSGYRTSFRFLCQAKNYEKAKFELRKAAKYADTGMDYYFDCMSCELDIYRDTKDTACLENALKILDESLKELKPTAQNVSETYINAAEIYLQLEQPDSALNCLNAAYNPSQSFNLGFDILQRSFEGRKLTEYDVEEMMEEDRAKVENMYGPDGVEELVAQTEPDEDGIRNYYTDFEEENAEEKITYKLDESDVPDFSMELTDQMTRLYIGAYTLKEDFEKVLTYARKLQGSPEQYSEYMGRYTYVNALKKLGRDEADSEYEKLIVFFRNAILRDPSDLSAVTYRIQCLVDMGRYDEAEQLCDLLSTEMKEECMKSIHDSRSGGDK